MTKLRKWPGAVDESSFFKLFRHGAEEVEQQNDVIYRYHAWKNKRHQRVHQSKLQNENIAWNQSAAEEHRYDEIP